MQYMTAESLGNNQTVRSCIYSAVQFAAEDSRSG